MINKSKCIPKKMWGTIYNTPSQTRISKWTRGKLSHLRRLKSWETYSSQWLEQFLKMEASTLFIEYSIISFLPWFFTTHNLAKWQQFMGNQKSNFSGSVTNIGSNPSTKCLRALTCRQSKVRTWYSVRLKHWCSIAQLFTEMVKRCAEVLAQQRDRLKEMLQ